MGNINLTPSLLALGMIQGMTYGILAVGLVIVYRTSRVINFAHGQIGAIGAAVCGLAVVRWNVPYWIALLLAIALSGAIGGVTEVVVVRRLQRAPKVMSLVATLGVASFLLGMSAVINGSASQGSNFPQPPGMPEFHIGVFLVTRAYSAMLFLSPVVVVILVAFLRYSRFGLALRAASANPERARLAGVSAARMSTLAWVISGAFAAYTVVLILPTQGFVTAEVLGPSLLLRALVPAVIARMHSMPIALVVGMLVGVLDQVLIFNYPTSGFSELFLLGVIVIALLVQPPKGGRQAEREDWSLLQPWGPLPEALTRVWAIRNLGRCVAAAGLAVAVLIAFRGSNSTAVTMVTIVAFSLIGLSIGILTGLGGQVSLGQFALAGVGATASYAVTYHTGNFLLGLAAAAAAAAAVSLVLGVPALRVRGPLLAVITLSFALAAQRWLLSQDWALGDGVNPGRPIVGPISLDLTKRYFLYALAVLVFGMWLARNIWTGGVGLRLRAQRDNEDAAKAFGMSTTLVRLQGFLVAGILAGLGGAVYGHLLTSITATGFDVVTSLNVVALAVLGGVGLLSGPLLGAVYIIGLPRFLPLDNAELAATSLGWLLLILYFPGGLAQVIAIPRERLIIWLARRAGVDTLTIQTEEPLPEGEFAAAGIQLRDNLPPTTEPQTGHVLEVHDIVKQFGGVSAVGGVSFSVAAGEILGIIGPNGAGKTTLFEVIGGFTRPDHGTVALAGSDISTLSAEARARRGLIRSFQDPALFATLTVTEAVTLAFERGQPTRFAASAAGWHRPERRKADEARELVSLMGLQPFRRRQIRELSTGTRRITELACIVALRPKVLLLDEPSSGIAQRESEALGEVLHGLRAYLDATFLIIEHDIPLLMEMSTRVLAMDRGKVVTIGTPQEVLNNPVVVGSYLGDDVAAIGRSGPRVSILNGQPERCSATTRAGAQCARRAGPAGTCGTHSQLVTPRW